MRVLAVIPARMGSERIPRKNAMEISPGISLAQHAVDCARWSGVCDVVAVSTDRPAALSIIGADVMQRPDELSGPTSDIASAVAWTTSAMESAKGCMFDLVVTLQPAVLARSPLIVRELVRAVESMGARGGLTMATSHRWGWTAFGSAARIDWDRLHYPRSQNSFSHLVEINAVQVADRETVAAGERWRAPLVLAQLPAWCSALDIDTPEDMAAARELWPWASPRLETCRPVMRLVERVDQAVSCPA
jgi:hypothetical protein